MELIGTGRQADVYALDERRVLRRYRDGTDATGEAEIMAYLSRFDFPTPRVYGAGGADLILERLDGRTLLGALLAGEMSTAEGAACLAGLHRRLHEVPPRPGGRAGDRILHRDLHPDNVLMTSRGPVVIDWNNVADGPPEVDVALTAVIVAQVAADPEHPMAEPARGFVAAFGRVAGDDVRAGLDAALAVRSADPALTAADTARLPEVAALIRFLSSGDFSS
ncbi:putative aminoglycoside phosphotransferase [Actinoplanes missouriensis 431]|uniref:Putative aminoglycoside phosphotransferase n=1 Tax=Actinoplanes missouriensis (strain ATCC 14538 / DSM 43046 / CBS 188.64 / JCM 3121 / NBRC 102363 / NCIMB 12654 / NRRL B-3342 / UNCC 431) TaxID=512565 RepID=I0HDG7_ACTM4|nr:phosphotransferase [Actinoplanes missouriensis]BAL91054.1 putative aminoglycoside phosphotransferase [Actinoplanes missouriensis 431]